MGLLRPSDDPKRKSSLSHCRGLGSNPEHSMWGEQSTGTGFFSEYFGFTLSIPSVARQPLLGPVIPQKTFHSSLSSRPLHRRIPRICDVSVRATSPHLILDFPTGLVLRNFPLRTFFCDPFIFHSYNMTRPSWPSKLNIIHDI